MIHSARAGGATSKFQHPLSIKGTTIAWIWWAAMRLVARPQISVLHLRPKMRPKNKKTSPCRDKWVWQCKVIGSGRSASG